MAKIKWKEDTSKYASGKIAYLGKYPVGAVSWNSSKTKGAKGVDYTTRATLPGLKPRLGGLSDRKESDGTSRICH